MITSYKPVPTSGGYHNLASDSADFICTNCTMMKDKKGKRKSLDTQPHHTRTITDYESGEIICSACGMVISDKIQSSGSELRNFEQVIGSSSETNAPRRHSGTTFSLARYN
jgi:TFIIB zinc-binding